MRSLEGVTSEAVTMYNKKHFQLVFSQGNLFGPVHTISSIKYDYTSLSWLCLLLFDGDVRKLKCIKQEISLCTIPQKINSFTAMMLNPDPGDSLLEHIKFLPSTSAYWRRIHTLIWLCPLQKARSQVIWWENNSGTLPNTLQEYSGITEVGAFSNLFPNDSKIAAKQTNAFTLKHQLPKSFWLKAYCTPQDYGEKILH